MEIYGSCQKNHSTCLGVHVTDGCGEFKPNHMRPAGDLYCEACGCHRSFHAKVIVVGVEEHIRSINEHIRSVNEQPSPTELAEPETSPRRGGVFRYTPEQKEKMTAFGAKLGWKMPGRVGDQSEIRNFLAEIGVSRTQFRTWLHRKKKNVPPQ